MCARSPGTAWHVSHLNAFATLDATRCAPCAPVLGAASARSDAATYALLGVPWQNVQFDCQLAQPFARLAWQVVHDERPAWQVWQLDTPAVRELMNCGPCAPGAPNPAACPPVASTTPFMCLPPATIA